ncbi:vWA domain-containing protein [Virgibacillus alimentarius]|uniref:Nitric oxide reductase activation protein n=1 Tax=Virgibacillus alimentarius TaxID=698769 RepID=A0ABS4SB29_9BACI|nr:VWA domain-containing protein [Virgibacillus alimentarius]MBP2258717.1 nitric oxide reductase activation protein [Virgibacillus alimentarius]
MKYNRWVDTKIDTNLYRQLQDLTTVLSGQPDLLFEYSYGSYMDIVNGKVTGSRLWDVEKHQIRESGYKTDVFLRTIGTMYYSSVPDLKMYADKRNHSMLPKFSSQLFTLLEDLRLEDLIKKVRPGTEKDFSIRNHFMRHYFGTQLATNVTRSYTLSELFCLISLTLYANQPDPYFPKANEGRLNLLEKLKPSIYSVFEAKNTKDIIHIVEHIVLQTELYEEEDMINDYFVFPIAYLETLEENTLFDELTRTDKLANEDKEEIDEDNNEYMDQRFSTWHRENQNSDRKQNFLQFEMEVGTKTNLMGGGTRETDDADQAMGTVQGASGKSDKNDYSELESLERETNKDASKGDSPYGEENKDAIAIRKEAHPPSKADKEVYHAYASDIEAAKRKLATTIKKTLEHKMNAPRKDLVIGRLSKKLMPLVIDENPRVFYKKSEESNEIDAVFTLLVDCSASMHNKMEETKRGIVLFHEVLKQLKIPHSIVGFWEDANEVKKNYQPNYFHLIHTHADFPSQTSGAKIMQLEPEEDNRDGFSIRIMTEDLAKRREKHKFLLVFSDGEPAAANYDQNGIVDTNIAVTEARNKGIDVVGMFLADGEIDEQDDTTMKNIYGKERVMIPNVSELPEHFAPILKKLLFKSI